MASCDRSLNLSWDFQSSRGPNSVRVTTPLDLHDSEGHAVGAMSKVYCSETMFQAVFEAMQVMGVNALDRDHPVERYLREALVFPLYDAGNIGMQCVRYGASWPIPTMIRGR